MKKSIVFMFALLLIFSQVNLGVLAEDIISEEPVTEPESEPNPLPIPEPIPEPLPEPDPLPEPELPPEPEEVQYFLTLNEILADPKEDEATNEFIEIYNPGPVAIDLRGWRLDDSRADDGSYSFDDPQLDYLLEAGEYLALFRPETKITLNNDTDSLILLSPEGQVVDFFEFSSQGADRSWGRNPDNLLEWVVLETPSPGAVNFIVQNQPPVALIDVQQDSAYMKLNVTGENSFDPEGDSLTFKWEFEEGVFDERENPTIYEYFTAGEKIVRLTVTDFFGNMGLAEILFTATPKVSVSSPPISVPSTSQYYPSYSLINEVMPDPEGADEVGEWVELYNEFSFGLDLSGWYLDDAEGGSSPYRISDGVTALPNSYLLFLAPDLKLSFKNSDDIVRLLNPNKEVSQEITYLESQEGWSYARQASGDYEWTPLFSPGGLNTFPAPPRAYTVGDVMIESVLPNPEGTDTGNEQIVMGNRLNEAVSLLGWVLEDAGGTEQTFGDLIIESGDHITLYSLDFKLSLNNSDEALNLFDPAGNLIDTVFWKSSVSGQPFINPNSLKDGMTAEVTRVIDGDTIEIRLNDSLFTVRLIGVDTPETVHPYKPIEYYGKEAAAYLTELLMGKLVNLEFDENRTDKYGRLLAYAYLDDMMVNEEMIRLGYGYAYTRFPFMYREEFQAFEDEARQAKRGLWADPEAQIIVEKMMAEDAEESKSEPIPAEKPTEDAENTEDLTVESFDDVDCSSEFLKINSFMPNPQKGQGTEYIRLTNMGTEAICFQGWSLDDPLEGGSKPFAIRGGGIAPGGYRTFRRAETKLALNDSNDCVSLIDPAGNLADQICYKSTHKGEVFTHEGGDWKAKPKAVKKASKAKSPTTRFSFKRDLISYQSDLPASEYTGKINYIDEEAKAMTLEIGQCGRITVSYANSPVNISTAKELIDFSEPVTVRVYDAGSVKNLLAIESAETESFEEPVKKRNFWPLAFLSLNGFCWLLFWFRRRG